MIRKALLVLVGLLLIFHAYKAMELFGSNPQNKDLEALFQEAVLIVAVLYGGILAIVFLTAPTTKKGAFRGLALLMGTVLMLILCEAGTRMAYTYSDAFRNIGAAETPDDPRRECALGELFKPSPYEGIIYELKPNMTCRLNGRLIRTNGEGMRDERPVGKKGPNELRILGLGDSIMFGWGVEIHDSFLRVMEDDLRDRLDRPVTCLNHAVPGYNTKMEEQVLLHKGMPLDPDIVILSWCGNDYYLPNFLVHHKDPFDTDLFLDDLLKRYLARALSRDGEGSGDWGGLVPTVENDEQALTIMKGVLEGTMQGVPKRYYGHVGKKVMFQCLKDMKTLLDGKGIDFVVLISGVAAGSEDPEIIKMCENLDIAVVDTFPRFYAYWEVHGDTSTQVAPNKDIHPNPEGHKLIASALEDYISRQLTDDESRAHK